MTLDLFGADQSSNAAIFYSAGLKGRFEEGKRPDDHQLKDRIYKVLEVADGALREREVPMLNALNEVLRDEFIKDSESGVSRWNKIVEKSGLPFRLSVPHKAFNRQIGTLSGIRVAPDGRPLDQEEWARGVGTWLPTDEDRAYVASLMKPVLEPGQYAGWIAPPQRAINKQPMDLPYVRFN